MFFVSKKKYNKMIYQYEEEKKELIRQLNCISDEKTELELKYNCLKSDRVNSQELLKQNNKLIDWIEKILKEVGICKAHNIDVFKIPILYNEKITYNIKDFDELNSKEETIFIPSIEIRKVKIF